MPQKLTYMTSPKEQELIRDIEKNLERYRSGDFSDILSGPRETMEFKTLEVDYDLLKKLDLSTESKADTDAKNAWLIFRAFPKMTPSVARESRVWTRLCHTDGLEYARTRWQESDPKKEVANIRKHFFADGLTRCRDDNALARLWWTAKIAQLIAPEEHQQALNLIFSTADTRLNFVERSGSFNRLKLSAGVMRLMLKEEYVTSKDTHFRELMKRINRQGGGILFEQMQETEIDGFMYQCLEYVQANEQRKAA